MSYQKQTNNTQYSDEEIEVDQNVHQTNEYLKKIGENLETDKSFYRTVQYNDTNYAQIQRDKGNTRGYQSRNWCFTWNNYSSDHRDRLSNLDGVEYIVYGYELSPTTATPHLQGFISFANDQTFGKKTRLGFHRSSLKGRFPEIYWKPMYSDAAACIKYCKKEKNFFEEGTEPQGRGARTDLSAVCDQIVAGELTITQIAHEHPHQFVRYSRGFYNLYALLQEHRDERPRVFWFFGESGTGKTEYAFRRHGKENVYVKQDACKFWDDYDQQPAIVINEYVNRSTSSEGWSVQYLLQLIDRYKFNVQIKGGQMKLNSPCIYITSIQSPMNLFTEPDFIQVVRRMDMIYYVHTDDSISPMIGHQYYDPDKDVPRTFTSPMLDDAYDQCLTNVARRALNRTNKHKPITQKHTNISDDDLPALESYAYHGSEISNPYDQYSDEELD